VRHRRLRHKLVGQRKAALAVQVLRDDLAWCRVCSVCQCVFGAGGGGVSTPCLGTLLCAAQRAVVDVHAMTINKREHARGRTLLSSCWSNCMSRMPLQMSCCMSRALSSA
jgi:hypothetical protein